MSSEIIISIILIGVILLSICLGIYIIYLKSQIKRIKNEIENNKQLDYNSQITVDLVDKDINELAVSINELLDYKKKLGYKTEHIEENMKQAIADIAHDVRTPITVINGDLQLLEKTPLNEKQLEYVESCKKKTNSLKNIIDDFFEMTLLESNQMPVSVHSVDMTEFVISYMLEHENVIREHNLEPSLNIPQKSIIIKADNLLLMRIFDNILNNIFKYAKDTFAVFLSEDGEVVFENVIPKDCEIDTNKLFTRSYKGDKARTDNNSKGLGLYIVKLLSEKMGAEVNACSIDNKLQISIRFELYIKL